MTGGSSKGGKDPGKSEKERPAIVAGGGLPGRKGPKPKV